MHKGNPDVGIEGIMMNKAWAIMNAAWTALKGISCRS